MALRPFNSVDGFSVSDTGNVIIDAAGNITTDSITVAKYANLGSIANIKISGGSNGYVVSTDGAGNLSFVAQSNGGGGGNTSITSPMPTLINSGETYYVTANHQGLFSVPIEINGALEVNGVLVQTDGIAFDNATTNKQVFFNDNSVITGSANLTFDKATSTLTANHFVATSGANLGTISNITITGGSSGYVLSTNGSGGLSWVAQTGGGGSYGNSNVATYLANYGSNTITTTGNVSVGNVIGNGQALTGITGANVSGQVSNSLIAGTVYTNAQPNITSVGTLTALTVSGNATFTGSNVSLGAVGNLKITGGTNAYVLSTDGTGNLSWVAQTGGGGATDILSPFLLMGA